MKWGMDMINNLFRSPHRILYGKGAIKNLGKEAVSYGRKAMIVVGKHSAKKSGALDKTIKSLEESNIEVVIFDEVESDPSVETVMKGFEIAEDEKVDFLIALGGGSALDAAKAISIIISNGGNIVDYEFKEPEKECTPVIGIPTTAGTGSEVSRSTIITDKERKIKMLISTDKIIPKVAILDPELTLTVPPKTTAATGMDALTHAIEGYISKIAQPISSVYALKAIELIGKNLPKAVLDGDNLEAREGMLLGQLYAGLAFSNASVALVHAMSRPLGVYFEVPHGMANAILLPKVMEFNRASVQEKFCDIAKALGENVDNLTIREGSYKAVEAVSKLYDEVGLPKKLREVGVDKNLLGRLAEDAYVNKSATLNPRKASYEEVKKIYEEVY